MELYNASYNVNVGEDNPYIKGIACIIASIALALPLLFLLCLQYGPFEMSAQAAIRTLSIYSGVLTIAIVVSLSMPTYLTAARSQKLTGQVTSFKSRHVREKNAVTQRMLYSAKVKYECEGRSYEAQLPSWSSVRPTVGAPISLRVDPENPSEPISVGQLVFIIFATVIFIGAGILFGSIGFLVDTDNSEEFTKPFAGGEGVNWALIGWIAFIVFWLLLGIIIIVRTKKRLAKKDLRKTGKRQVCTIEEVDVNTSVVVNGMYPVKIVCSGGGRTFNLKAKVLSTIMRIDEANCPYKVGGKIDIYIDPENEKNYEADFEKLLAEAEEADAYDEVSVEQTEKILADFKRLLDEANR